MKVGVNGLMKTEKANLSSVSIAIGQLRLIKPIRAEQGAD